MGFVGLARKPLRLIAFCVCIIVSSVPSEAGETAPWSKNGLSEPRFHSLAIELSGKVNLFRETWRQVPDALFAGGTVRDYLYWLRMHLADAKSPLELEKKISNLRSLSSIDIRDFVHEESDIDYATKGKKANLAVEDYGVTKLDAISPMRFTPGTPEYASEIHQGYIPIEKMLLGRDKLTTAPGFGNGVSEVFSGRPTVHFSTAEEFAQTIYAKAGSNHRILLVMRYIRTLSLNHAKTGHALGDAPVVSDLLASVDPKTESAIREIVRSAREGVGLQDAFRHPSFAKWFRATMEKSFRAYVHPTATYYLFEHFGLDRLVAQWPEQSVQVNQLVFAKPRLPRNLAEFDLRIRAMGYDPTDIFRKTENYFGPSHRLYHGTHTDEAFSDIILRGVISSKGGWAGPGVYGVAEADISFAEKWGGSKANIVKFEVARKARILDLTSGDPKVNSFHDALVEKFGVKISFDELADYIGADIIKYPYEVGAYVVKNASVLSRAEGAFRTVMTFSQALEQAKYIRSTPMLLKFLEGLSLSRSFTSTEWNTIFDALDGSPTIARALRDIDLQKLTRPGHAKAFFVGAYALMSAVSNDIEFRPSRHFLETILGDSAIHLAKTQKETTLVNELLAKYTPDKFGNKSKSLLMRKLGTRYGDLRENLRRISVHYRSRAPFAVVVGLHGIVGLAILSLVSNDEYSENEKQNMLIVFGAITAVTDATLIGIEWKAYIQAAKDLNGTSTTRSFLGRVRTRGKKLACAEWLEASPPNDL